MNDAMMPLGFIFGFIYFIGAFIGLPIAILWHLYNKDKKGK